ncbi:hypothetical protein N7E70_007180 [Aminobacter sp. NyZ550]|uniref:hypothetical protein n=1 Tax=Aminobacter sp. NyZ550 TaxID=2979870 RepID=UPI0021D5F512|nr:hypothetical protein [Aminobacter sp. NyZ550]WAX96636.1 hypothetical protein N7E70_007180 [Aminobacter sp. NyZ550]
MQPESLFPHCDELIDIAPPSRESIEFDETIDGLIFQFWKATLRHVDVAFELQLALSELRRHRPAFALDGGREAALSRAIVAAISSSIDRLPPGYNRRQLTACGRAALVIVRHWSREPGACPAHADDARLLVGLVDRDLRNMLDFSHLQERKANRRQATVAELMRKTGGSFAGNTALARAA